MRINGSTLTTPFGILMKHYEPGYGDSSSRTYLRKGWTEPSGDFLYLGATGNRNNNAQTAIFLSQNSSRGLLIGRGHNDADQISTEWARINGDGLTVLGDASVDGDLTVGGEIIGGSSSPSPRGVFNNGIIDCGGGVELVSGSKYKCNNPKITLLHTVQSDYDNLFYEHENNPIAIDALTLGAVCGALGMKYESTGSSYDNVDWTFDSNADVIAWIPLSGVSGWQEVGDNDYINWVNCNLLS